MPPTDANPAGPDPSEIDALAFRYFDGLLDGGETARLNALLRSSESARDRFADYAMERFVLREILVAQQNEDDARSLLDGLAELDSKTPAPEPIDITGLLTQREQRRAERQRLRTSGHRDAADSPVRVIVIPKVLAYGLGAAVAAVLAGMVYLGFFAGRGGDAASPGEIAEAAEPAPRPVAVGTLVSAEGAVWSDGGGPAVGGRVMDRGYRLTAGAAMLRMHGGAVVRVEAPAAFDLVSPTQMMLRSGRLVGFCDDSAAGFVVETANARFVDLGTQFGVIVEQGRTSELHVFDGVVEAEAFDTRGVGRKPAWVVAGQATRIDAGAAALTPIPLDPRAFDTTTPRAMDLRYGGAGLTADRPVDTDWRLVAIDGVDVRPRPAVLFDPGTLASHLKGRYLANNPAGSQWLTPPDDDLTRIGTRFCFERSLDLTGLDPRTVELTLRMIADNYITQVQLNGRPVYELAQTPTVEPGATFTDFHAMLLNKGFEPGVNTLRIEIGNPASLDTPENYTALRVELDGTAQDMWYDTAEDE